MINIRLAILEKIYELYDEVLNDFSFFCHKGCGVCCTRNVTLTSLEGFFLIEHIDKKKSSGSNERFEDVLKKTVSLPRFIPRTTANGFASLMMSGVEEPDELIDPSWTPCPFLGIDGVCGVYDARPFNCRCMHSEEKCESGGYSVLSPFVVTLNNVFLQYIEHLDKKGFVSNLSDMCLWMADSGNRQSYSDGRLSDLPSDFVMCMAMPFIMAPPEHQDRLRPILKSLSDVGTAYNGVERK